MTTKPSSKPPCARAFRCLRLIIEGDPFSIIEAMTIAGYGVGAAEGYIYIRGEYKLAYKRLEHAIHQAEERGLLGDHIFGKDFIFHIHLHSGAGAYICGEETALIESIEGKRGQPRARPPYPPTYGLWGKPTLVNNVETLANIPHIVRNGGEWYHQYGNEKSRGTKIYTMMGNVIFTGVIEVPLGITLREVIEIYGKGMKKGAPLKLVQTGGSSGSIVPAHLQDTPMDFESWRSAGASLGSGALLICNEHTCVVLAEIDAVPTWHAPHGVDLRYIPFYKSSSESLCGFYFDLLTHVVASFLGFRSPYTAFRPTQNNIIPGSPPFIAAEQLMDVIRVCWESVLLILVFYSFWPFLSMKLYKNRTKLLILFRVFPIIA